MEQGDDPRLCLCIQIDQQVAAGDKVYARERGVGQDILHREHHL